jgi:hypothetical protein
MPTKLETLVREWDDPELRAANLRLVHLEKRLYKTYEPSMASRRDYWNRFDSWIDNVAAAEDKKALLRLAPEIFYVGPDEFHELYRYAYENVVAAWHIDQLAIDILDPNAQQTLRGAVDRTWFCPVSDSMRINSFYHVNNLPPRGDLRPDWRSLAKFADINGIRHYCQAKGIHRLVLFEDFVGGGSQAKAAVEFAAQLIPDVQVLVVPLIVCPAGHAKLQILAQNTPGLTYRPVLGLPDNAFLTNALSPFDAKQTAELRSLVARTYGAVSHGALAGDPPYNAFGFPELTPTGALVVMFSNTPDNTLPLIHHQSQTWEPVFPRHSRV